MLTSVTSQVLSKVLLNANTDRGCSRSEACRQTQPSNPRQGRHQDYLTAPAVSQTSLFRHLQICILALLSVRVLTPRLAIAGSGLLLALCRSLSRHSEAAGPRGSGQAREQSCLSISDSLRWANPPSTGNWCLWTNQSVLSFTRQFLGVRTEVLCRLPPLPKQLPLPTPHLSALAWKIRRRVEPTRHLRTTEDRGWGALTYPVAVDFPCVLFYLSLDPPFCSGVVWCLLRSGTQGPDCTRLLTPFVPEAKT